MLVERVEIKDVSVPEQLQRAMASTAEAAREARAKVIAAEGELQASRSLAHAADVIVDCPEALQVEHKYSVTSSIVRYTLAITFSYPSFAKSIYPKLHFIIFTCFNTLR